jgi:hypothetical protein
MSMSLLMTKKRRSGQLLEKPQFDFKVTETIHEETDNSELETEIECPSCQNTMELYSVSESLQFLSVYEMVTNRILPESNEAI